MIIHNAMAKVLDFTSLGVEAVAVVVLTWGVASFSVRFVREVIRETNRPTAELGMHALRAYLGTYILLGLELLVVADIIRTIFDPDWETLGMLAGIVVIRSVLSFLLTHEMKDAEAHTANGKA